MDVVWSPHPNSVTAANLIADNRSEARRDKWELWEDMTGEKVSERVADVGGVRDDRLHTHSSHM